ncbi:MAG: hypothetical protein LBP54_08900 [Campylobacteraceae bacterium]|jgi:hypothetical protein|nr:hypothetical protein [Campylobacteraceae bacterium]
MRLFRIKIILIFGANFIQENFTAWFLPILDGLFEMGFTACLYQSENLTH